MTKNEFLLNVAIEAMGWGEGADFEMTELICENYELMKQFEKHYGIKYPNDEAAVLPNPQRQAWGKALDRCQSDAIFLLRELKKPFECPEYKAEQERKVAEMQARRDAATGFKGKLEAIALYRQQTGASLKDARDYVEQYGWTPDGKLK